MGLYSYVRRWLGIEPQEMVDGSILDAVRLRRFRAADREKFEQVWCDVARILRVSPATLSEEDELKVLANEASQFPYTIMDELADMVSEESTGVPETNIVTVGELVDWLLANARSTQKIGR